MFHQTVNMWNVGNLRRELLLVGEECGVAMRIVGVIPMHGSNGPLSHVAGHDKNAFLHEKDQLPKLVIIEMRP